MDKRTLKKIEAGELEVLARVEKFDDITFGHILLVESVMKALGLDPTIIMDVVRSRKRAIQNDAAFRAEVKALYDAGDVRGYNKKMAECVPLNRDGNIDLGDVLDAIKRVHD